jgi:AcrR family transcriptional regulator
MENLRQRKKDERMKRIQDSALKLFGKDGFQKTTISKIAEKANLGTGTVYNYFKSKEEILFSIIQDRSDEYVSRLDQIIDKSDKDIFGDVSSFIDIYLESFSIYNKTIWREMIGTGLSKNLQIMSLVDKVDQGFIERFSELLNKFQENGILRNDIKAEDLVSIIDNLMMSHILRYISDKKMSLNKLKKNINHQIQLVLNNP